MAKVNYIKERFHDFTGNKVINPDFRFYGIYRSSQNIKRSDVHHDAMKVNQSGYNTRSLLESHARIHGRRGYGNTGLLYHFVIDNAGQIIKCRDYKYPTYNAGNAAINKQNVAIMLPGYYHPPHNQQPTREQLEALPQLYKWLKNQGALNVTVIGGHRDHSSTACCGDVLYKYVTELKRTGTIKIPSKIKYAFPDWGQTKPKPKPKLPDPPKKPSTPQYLKELTDKDLPDEYITKTETKLLKLPDESPVQMELEIDGEKVKTNTFPEGHRITIAYKTKNNGTWYGLTSYSVKNKKYNAVLLSDLKPYEEEDRPDDHTQDHSGGVDPEAPEQSVPDEEPKEDSKPDETNEERGVDMDNGSKKPGVKTTEFWLTLGASLVAALQVSFESGEGVTVGEGLGLVAIVLAALGYTAGRVIIKNKGGE